MKKLLFILISLILIQTTLALTIDNGNSEDYLGRTIKVDAVKEDKIIVSVDGDRNTLRLNQSKEFSGLKVTLTDIFYAEDVSTVTINAELTYSCGDGVCNLGEDTTCCTDCGCSLFNEVCQENECIVPECKTDSECDDSNSLTIDSCNNSKCEHSSERCSKDLDCDDNNTDTDDSCTNNKCQNIINYICKTNLDCDDSNPCTKDQCVNKDCVTTPIEDCKNEPLEMKKVEETTLNDNKQGIFKSFFSWLKNLF